MKNIALSILVAALFSSTVFGGSLDSKVVGGDATWVAHVDIESILDSELGKLFLAEAAKKEGFDAGIATMKKEFGCDPLQDIRGITLYGPRLGEDDGVIVVDATLATDKLIDLLKEKDSYKSAKYGQHTIHQWTEENVRGDENDKRYGCFYDNKTVVVATGDKRLHGALDVLDGKSDSLAKTKKIESLPDAAKGAFFILAADKIEFPQGKAPRAEMLKRISAVSAQGGEDEDGLFLQASITAGSDEDAANMRKFAQGFLALV